MKHDNHFQGLDIIRLLDDLQVQKRDYEYNLSCKLTKSEKRYFCLLICGYSSPEIAFIYDKKRIPQEKELIQNQEKLKRKSRNLQKQASKGLHKYLKSLLGLDESVYLPQASKLIKILKEKGYGIKNEDFEHFQELFESGELNKILGVEVVDIGITLTEIPTKSVVLSQWLRGIIEPTWEIIKTFRDTPDPNLAFRTQNESNNQPNDLSTICKKTYNLGTSIDGNYVELIVKIKLDQSQAEMDVNVRVQPCKNQPYLPPGLKLILLVDSDFLAEVEARNSDNAIQRGLTGDIGDNFSVKLALGDISIVEGFII